MRDLYQTALAEQGNVFTRLDDAAADTAVDMIADANNIVVFGGGHERLQIMGFAMRLYHMGLKSVVEGDMTPPPVATDDQGETMSSVLPMGTLYQGAFFVLFVLFVLFEVMILKLRDKLAIDPAAMRAQHTNLE